MAKVRNILFIMCDQLRWDYLSCSGHPTLETPNIDRLAARGVRFSQAYCPAPVCGPSRMSFYTGRYSFTHGATWNNVPLDVSEHTMGDYLRPLGLRVALAGKTHYQADLAGMRRLGISAEAAAARHLMTCGFEPFENELGHHGPNPDLDTGYNRYLRDLGYDSDNPWHDYANSALGPNGELLSGWHLRYARAPARIAREHSETVWLTGRGINFIDDVGNEPWCLHLSYIKPHWPYVAPAPYNDMYGPNQMIAVNRDPCERDTPHPVYAAYMNHAESKTFARDETRDTVIPVYMGLIKQIDDELGRLFAYLEEAGRMDDTLIVLTSDHGDYLGDHWLGEKDLFHDAAVRIPLIVYDPDAAADATRGAVETRFAEGIDLLPTFIDAVGGPPDAARLEGRSLLPLIRRRGDADGGTDRGADGADVTWRDYVVSENDYSLRSARLALGVAPADARMFMVRTKDWKYVHYKGFRPQLFDLANDPRELHDLGADPAYAGTCTEMRERLFESLIGRRTRCTMSDDAIAKLTGGQRARGMLFGQW